MLLIFRSFNVHMVDNHAVLCLHTDLVPRVCSILLRTASAVAIANKHKLVHEQDVERAVEASHISGLFARKHDLLVTDLQRRMHAPAMRYLTSSLFEVCARSFDRVLGVPVATLKFANDKTVARFEGEVLSCVVNFIQLFAGAKGTYIDKAAYDALLKEVFGA